MAAGKSGASRWKSWSGICELRHSSTSPYIEVVARVEGETEKRLLELHTM